MADMSSHAAPGTGVNVESVGLYFIKPFDTVPIHSVPSRSRNMSVGMNDGDVRADLRSLSPWGSILISRLPVSMSLSGLLNAATRMWSSS